MVKLHMGSTLVEVDIELRTSWNCDWIDARLEPFCFIRSNWKISSPLAFSLSLSLGSKPNPFIHLTEHIPLLLPFHPCLG